MDSRNGASSQQHSSHDQVGWTWKRQSLQGLSPKINLYYKTKVFDDIISTLTKVGGEGRETLQQFMDGCFGNLVHFIGGTYSSKALHGLISHEITLCGAREEELWFRVGGTNIRFAPSEYALVTGLWFGSSSFDPLASHELPQDGAYKRFCSGHSITVGELYKRFKTHKIVCGADEYLKVAHILALYLMGLGCSLNEQVDQWVWVLVEDLVMWNRFPWGAYTFQALLHYMNILPRTIEDAGQTYKFYGPVWALQTWAYEAIPDMGSKCAFVTGKFTMPRCLKWQFTSKRKNFVNFFEQKIACSETLDPTDEERLLPYWLSLQTSQPLGVGYKDYSSLHQQRVVQMLQQPCSKSKCTPILIEDDTDSSTQSTSSSGEEHDSLPQGVDQRIHVNEEEADSLNDSQVHEHKELSYKHFQVADQGSECGKETSNHFAMARYLAIDLADELKAEPDESSSNKGDEVQTERKRPRLDDDCNKGDAVQTERKRPRLKDDCNKEEALEKVRQLEKELNEKTNQMNDLIARNDEFQRARKELIKGLNDILKGNHVQIGIKNVGEIDSKVVISEMEKRFSPLFAVMKGVELCSLWQEKLKNPQWNPFQIIEDDKGIFQELLMEDDESLQDLKKEWGQVIHDAVVVALNDLHEYNLNGCYAVPELWNFQENRKASLDEVISYILEAVKDVFNSGINKSTIKEHREIGNYSDKQRDITDSDEESGTRESEIYKHKERIYKLLKLCIYKVRGPNGQLKCPFCFVEEEQEYNYLLRHALMAAESSSENVEQRARHFALAKYLVIDLRNNAEPPPQFTRSSPASRKTLDMNKHAERYMHGNVKAKKEGLGVPYQNLLAREQLSNNELQGAQNEVMKMYEIDVNAFKRAFRKRFPHGEAEIRAIAECCKWEEKLKNPHWHPFQTEDDKSKHERVVMDDDLRGLKDEWGEEVYNAVVAELNARKKRNKTGKNATII